MSQMSNPFTAAYPGPKCPFCRDKITQGDEVQYAPRRYPQEAFSASAKTVLWHSSCIWMATNVCSVCGAAEDEGACLL